MSFSGSVYFKSRYWFAIDDLSITPEPATLSLLALGGLAVMRRKRKN